MNFEAVREGVGIALDALRSNKARAFLTILGIVIGVFTVMAMSSIMKGLNDGIMGEINELGPNNFLVARWDQTQIVVNDGSEPPPWAGKPPITMQEQELMASLPSIQSVVSSVSTSATLRWGTESVPNVSIRGYSPEWPDYSKGEFIAGRNYIPAEAERAAPLIVLADDLAEALFGGTGNAVGRNVRVNGDLFRVIGVYAPVPNLFEGGGNNWAAVPTMAAIRRLAANEDWMETLVVPLEGITQEQAMDEVTVALRTARGLRPADENNFALIRPEALAAMVGRITGVMWMIMFALSSVGLLVGGVGVIAIMTISVTERTREIGVRKALGATRTEILWQFLVESMTVTVIGGAIGLVLGGAAALFVAAVTPLPASVPVWAGIMAILASAISGIGFGLYPAWKAALLDPVEALRYE